MSEFLQFDTEETPQPGRVVIEGHEGYQLFIERTYERTSERSDLLRITDTVKEPESDAAWRMWAITVVSGGFHKNSTELIAAAENVLSWVRTGSYS